MTVGMGIQCREEMVEETLKTMNHLLHATITPEGRWRPLVHAKSLEPAKRMSAVQGRVKKLQAKGWALVGFAEDMPEYGPIAVMECTKEQYDEEWEAQKQAQCGRKCGRKQEQNVQ